MNNTNVYRPKMKVVQYTFIVYRISKLGLSQSLIAKVLKCSVPMLNYVIQGKRTSKRIQEGLALILGASSWERLINAAYVWDEKVNGYERGKKNA